MKLSTDQATAEIKRIIPLVAMIGRKKELKWDFGYLIEEGCWEAEFYNDSGETLEYYKEPTTEELLQTILQTI